MRVADLTMLMLIINGAIDTGEYQDITIAEVWKHIDKGDLIPYLKDKIDDVELADRYDPVLAGEINKKMIGYLDWREQEFRKTLVKNSGLCLLLAILINMTLGEIQEART